MYNYLSIGAFGHYVGRATEKTNMSEKKSKKLPPFLKTVYLSNREIRLLLAGLYSLKMPKKEIEETLWKKLLFEKLHKKTRRKKD
jgi:hypothetical protein